MRSGFVKTVCEVGWCGCFWSGCAAPRRRHGCSARHHAVSNLAKDAGCADLSIGSLHDRQDGSGDHAMDWGQWRGVWP